MLNALIPRVRNLAGRYFCLQEGFHISKFAFNLHLQLYFDVFTCLVRQLTILIFCSRFAAQPEVAFINQWI
jgi:hypothetical protein